MYTVLPMPLQQHVQAMTWKAHTHLLSLGLVAMGLGLECLGLGLGLEALSLESKSGWN